MKSNESFKVVRLRSACSICRLFLRAVRRFREQSPNFDIIFDCGHAGSRKEKMQEAHGRDWRVCVEFKRRLPYGPYDPLRSLPENEDALCEHKQWSPNWHWHSQSARTTQVSLCAKGISVQKCRFLLFPVVHKQDHSYRVLVLWLGQASTTWFSYWIDRTDTVWIVALLLWSDNTLSAL